jgi:tetratricopeptide (TPR) repeat protein
LYAANFETPYEEIKYSKQLLEFDNQLPRSYSNLGLNYNKLYQYDKAIPELEKALEIYKKWGSKPMWIDNYTQLGIAYHKTGKYTKEKELYKKAEQDFPNDPLVTQRQAILSFTKGDTVEATQFIEKYISILKEKSSTESDIKYGLAKIYSEAGACDKAEKCYRQALSVEPDSSWNLNNLAYFLIDKDRNINEGLKLVGKALELSPDNYEYFDTKGCGLYKQGKYQEALDILQKSWDLRMKNAIYDHEAYLHLEAAKKAVAIQKNN